MAILSNAGEQIHGMSIQYLPMAKYTSLRMTSATHLTMPLHPSSARLWHGRPDLRSKLRPMWRSRVAYSVGLLTLGISEHVDIELALAF